MKKFNYSGRNIDSGSHFLGTLLLVAGLITIVSPAFINSNNSIEKVLGVGIGALTIGLLIVSSYSGTLINFAQKRFKPYSSFAAYKFGKWTPLPDIKTIKVLSKSYLSTNTPNGISPTLSGKVTIFTTLLYTNSPEPILTFNYSKQDKAIKQAKQLAANLQADLVLSDELN